MPWCPKCKNEYKEGITICSDCGETLVAQLPDGPEYVFLLSVEQEALAHKFIEYLSYSGLSGKAEKSDNAEVPEEYNIYVPETEIKQAKKAFQAFYTVEAEAKAKEEAENTSESNTPEETIHSECSESNFQNLFSEDSDFKSDNFGSAHPASSSALHNTSTAPYVKKSEQYSDYKSTAATFLLFGIGGCILMVLNLLNIISIFNGIISEIVMSAVFIFFIGVGINSISRAKRAAVESKEEEKMNKQLNSWLEENLTKETLEKLSDPSQSDELNYLHLTEVLKSEIQKQFGITDEAYLDNVIDEYYSDRFDA